MIWRSSFISSRAVSEYRPADLTILRAACRLSLFGRMSNVYRERKERFTHRP